MNSTPATTAEISALTYFFRYSCQKATSTSRIARSSSSACTVSPPLRSWRLSVKPNSPAPMARPPGRQLPKIIAARPM